jgi:hypothetical protein
MQLNAHEKSALRDHAKDSQYCMTNFYGKLGQVGFGRAARTRFLGSFTREAKRYVPPPHIIK